MKGWIVPVLVIMLIGGLWRVTIDHRQPVLSPTEATAPADDQRAAAAGLKPFHGQLDAAPVYVEAGAPGSLEHVNATLAADQAADRQARRIADVIEDDRRRRELLGH